jgi:hypothetical protein
VVKVRLCDVCVCFSNSVFRWFAYRRMVGIGVRCRGNFSFPGLGASRADEGVPRAHRDFTTPGANPFLAPEQD